MKPQKVKLPNGMEIYSQRREEALLMYGEVGDYVKHGLTMQPGAVVFDVGANIGMFSLWAYEQCAGDVSVYAFEPVPSTFALLQANFEQIDGEKLHAFQFGLSKQAGQVTFAYYPNATFASTAYPDSAVDDQKLTETLLSRSLHQLPPILSFVRFLPAGLQKMAVQLLARYINQRRMVTCELRTISDVIHDQQINRIDFLKIDAEKSELDVLNGIAPADWAKVQQVFIEVHDREGRLESIRDLLNRQGFQKIIIEQEPFFEATDIHALYALRN